MTHAFPPLAIRGLGALSAAGLGVDALFDAALAGEPLARTVTRYKVASLATWCATLMPNNVAHQLNEQ